MNQVLKKIADAITKIGKTKDAWILGPEPFVWVTSVNGEKIKSYPHRNLSVSGERLPSPRDPWRELDKGC
jgi:hypothetical protein